jgi:hypothetical protein
MDETGSAFGTEDLELQERRNSAPDSGRRLLRRPTPAETEQIASDCAPEGLSVPVIVDAGQPGARARPRTGLSRTPSPPASLPGRRTTTRETALG